MQRTHSNPVVKMAMTPAFLFGAICKCHVAQIGRSRFRRSENTLTALETTSSIFLLIQCLVSSPKEGFQTSQIGRHSKIIEKKMEI